MAIEEGKKVPAFTLPDASGNRIALGDFAGHADLLGVSQDEPGKHAGFAERYDLPFTQLSDPTRRS